MAINWEREPGERIEDFAAAFLLLRAGVGNQIRPSRGDGGIDVQIPTAEGWDIYQVKRFARNLQHSEKRQIEESWRRFTESAPLNRVRSLSLVLPLEPTRENLVWLRELTDGSGIDISWIGRAQLDGWAAENPRLSEYFFGDGGQKWHELMALAFSGGRPLEDAEGAPLLASIQERAASLSRALDEVDPFYRYEIEMRTGSLDEISPEESLRSASRPGIVQSVFEQIDDDHYRVTHIIARSPVSDALRPITGTFSMTASTDDERTALEMFFLYGAPLEDGRATVVASSGPPGSGLPVGQTASSWKMFPSDDDDLPPLELRLVRGGDVEMVVQVTNSVTSAAIAGPGRWLQVQAGPSVTVEFFYGAPGRGDSIRLSAAPAPGADPALTLPGLELVAALPGASLEVGVRGGPPLAGGFEFEPNEVSADAAHSAPLVAALNSIQRFTTERVRIPASAELLRSEVHALLFTARLLEGEIVEGTFTAVDVTEGADYFASWDERPRTLTMVQPISVELDGATWELAAHSRRIFVSVQLERTNGRLTLRPGESNRVSMSAGRPSDMPN